MKKRYILLVSALIFASFVLFSYFVAKEKFVHFDFDTTVKIQDKLPNKIIGPFSLISLIGSAEITAFFCIAIMIYLVTKRLYLAALSIFLLPFGLALEVFGKLFVLHPGPPQFMHRTNIPFELPSFYVHTDFSYPSGHTLRLTYITLVIFILYLHFQKPTQKIIPAIIAFGFIFFVGLSRVYLGEHWTSDVVGGFLLACSLSLVTAVFIPWSKKN